MLTDYIRAAMSQAHYELLEDRTFYGEISGLQGVLANAATLETCRDKLQEVLEEWIILGLRLGHALPTVGGIQLSAALDIDLETGFLGRNPVSRQSSWIPNS